MERSDSDDNSIHELDVHVKPPLLPKRTTAKKKRVRRKTRVKKH